jgi:hypothetical protein
MFTTHQAADSQINVSESSRVTCNVLPNFPGLAEFPLVFIFSMHQKEGNQRVVEEPPNWRFTGPYLIVETYCSYRQICRRSITATTSLSDSLIPFYLHKWWELYHVISLAREKRTGLADISRTELERNFALSRLQSVKRPHLTFSQDHFLWPQYTFIEIFTTRFISKQDSQCRYNEILKHLYITIVAVEKQ